MNEERRRQLLGHTHLGRVAMANDSAAEFFDESKVNRNKGRFAPKDSTSGGTKSADAAVAEQIKPTSRRQRDDDAPPKDYDDGATPEQEARRTNYLKKRMVGAMADTFLGGNRSSGKIVKEPTGIADKIRNVIKADSTDDRWADPRQYDKNVKTHALRALSADEEAKSKSMWQDATQKNREAAALSDECSKVVRKWRQASKDWNAEPDPEKKKEKGKVANDYRRKHDELLDKEIDAREGADKAKNAWRNYLVSLQPSGLKGIAGAIRSQFNEDEEEGEE